MNSVFVQSGIYSSGVDCFLEASRYLFLLELSKLTKRSEFPELLFTAASNYRNQGGNSSCLPTSNNQRLANAGGYFFGPFGE